MLDPLGRWKECGLSLTLAAEPRRAGVPLEQVAKARELFGNMMVDAHSRQTLAAGCVIGVFGQCVARER